MYAGADVRHRMRCRIVTETAWHALFIRAMLIRPEVCVWRGLFCVHMILFL